MPVKLAVPTRGRPESARRLITAWAGTGVCSDLIFCVDMDDPQLPGYLQLREEPHAGRGQVQWRFGARDSLAGWTNQVAADVAGTCEAVMSLGDDFVPETGAFDRKLLEAARGVPGGMAYGDDGAQHENLPTAFLVLTRTIRALGWLCLPGVKHMFVDAAVKHLGELCGIAYLPGVSVRHLHYTTGLAPYDATYQAGYASWAADELVFRAWLAGPIAADAKKVLDAAREAARADV